MTNYFRTDGWVKSVTGAAVPGAQVFVCLQPANQTVPPTPLASVFSDVNGLVPITQPIITDGFGHYDFYAPAAVYTIIVALGGVIQQVYVDQSVGGASGTSGGGGTALILQVNGTPNANQLLLNLQGQNSVAVSDAGNGTISIAGSVFQVNGLNNTLQTKVNLISGTGITLTADALGGVTVTNSSPGTVPAGANVITMPSLNFTTNFPASTTNTANSSGATNTFVQYVPGNSLHSTPSSWKVSITTSSASTTVTLKVVKCAVGSNVVISSTDITFNGGQVSPTLSPAGQYTSDTINLALSTGFDYFFLLNSSTGLIMILAAATATYGTASGVYIEPSNMIGQSTLTFTGGSLQSGKSILYSFNAV